MAFTMKKGSGSANANTEGTFSASDSNTLNTLKAKAFMDPGAPEGFKADAPEVTGTVRQVSSKPIKFGDHGYGINTPTVRDIEGKEIRGAGEMLERSQIKRKKQGENIPWSGSAPRFRELSQRGNVRDASGRVVNEFLTVKTDVGELTRPHYRTKK